jgi:hypothetical protein
MSYYFIQSPVDLFFIPIISTYTSDGVVKKIGGKNKNTPNCYLNKEPMWHFSSVVPPSNYFQKMRPEKNYLLPLIKVIYSTDCLISKIECIVVDLTEEINNDITNLIIK